MSAYVTCKLSTAGHLKLSQAFAALKMCLTVHVNEVTLSDYSSHTGICRQVVYEVVQPGRIHH